MKPASVSTKVGENPEVTRYEPEFYEGVVEDALRSARFIIPIVLEHLPVRSVVDIGCGCGAWLHALEECGVADVVGYDGDYVERSMLLIDQKKFRSVDLRNEFGLPRRFDLAISLEVAEHLPSEFAERFIGGLAAAAPAVLFSAAIPGQFGFNHVNLRWQDYWRAIFRSYQFYPVDLVRPMVWGNTSVKCWYQQNTILYCNEETYKNNCQLHKVPDERSLNVVHPEFYEGLISRPTPDLREVVKLFPSLVWDAAARRIKRMWPTANKRL
jgi:SAM-dependent methyltransferase